MPDLTYSSCEGPAPTSLAQADHVVATRVLKRMKGGSQPFLIEASDGKAYVTKTTATPQHVRSLVSEWICSALLSSLGINCPKCAFVHLGEEFLRENPDVYIEGPDAHRPVKPGYHFGSLHPGWVERDATYDWIPERLHEIVLNKSDFLGMFVFDNWVMQSDRRQTIYVRERIRSASRPPGTRGLRAYMIDHGLAFGGITWRFSSSIPASVVITPMVFRGVSGLSDLDPWLTAIEQFPEDHLRTAVRSVPSSWILDDGALLDGVIEQLLQRRSNIRKLVRATVGSMYSSFPDWKPERMSATSQTRKSRVARDMKRDVRATGRLGSA